MRADRAVSENTYDDEVYLKAAALQVFGLDALKKTTLKKRSEKKAASSPNLSAEQLMGNALLHIREYYNADACLAVMKMPDDSYIVFKTEKGTQKPLLGHALDESIALHLLATPPQNSIFYTPQVERCIPSQTANRNNELLLETTHSFGEAISDLLEADSFASVPLQISDQLQEQYMGRLYLTNCCQYFDETDLLLLQEMANQITPQIKHIYWQHNISAKATLAMRQKISIDLHDSTIQPYIGLKLGLEALRRKIPEGAEITAEVDELVSMAEESIAELRQYITGLKSQIKSQLNSQLGSPLVDFILEVAKKYQLRHGIEVVVNADTKLQLSEHLTTEIYQLICEGLSNIHRHTQSKKAEINLYYQSNQLVIEVINQDDNTQDFIHFKPRSMTERAACLGGTISVNHATGANMTENKTIVTAKIPLQFMKRHCATFA